MDRGQRWRWPAVVAGLVAAPAIWYVVDSHEQLDPRTGVSTVQQDNLVDIPLNQKLTPGLKAAIALPKDGSEGRLTIYTSNGAPIDETLRSRLKIVWNNNNGSPSVQLAAPDLESGKPYLTVSLAMTDDEAAVGDYELRLDYPGTKLGEVRLQSTPRGVVAKSETGPTFDR